MAMSISGIAGGIVSRATWEAARHALCVAAHWRYAQLSGSDATSGKLHLVVGALVPPPCQDQTGKPYPFVFSKPGIQNAGFSTSVAIPSCEVRAAKYLAESVAVNSRRLAILTTDLDIADKRDLSFVSFGLMSNLKTIQLLENSANHFARYDDGRFIAKLSGRILAAILFTLVGQTIAFRGLPPSGSAGRRHKPIVCPTETPLTEQYWS
jgi:hypothetical protein